MTAEEEFIKHFLKETKRYKIPVTRETPIEKPEYTRHWKVPKKALCSCGADLVHLGGSNGWFCINQLKKYLKETKYQIIKVKD